jgi:hypothetical protein
MAPVGWSGKDSKRTVIRNRVGTGFGDLKGFKIAPAKIQQLSTTPLQIFLSERYNGGTEESTI